jgi:thiamine biosynthesis lipoprotein
MNSWLVIGLLLLPNSLSEQQITSRKVVSLMGSRFELVAVNKDPGAREDAIASAISEIIRIENLVSSWKSTSETSQINANAGIKPVQISQELYHLIERAIKVSRLTDGAFDISYASIDHLWTFDGKEAKMPDSSTVSASIRKIDFNHIILNSENQTVFLSDKGMKIGFGAIGKGYAANKAKLVMQEHDIENGLINAGGDLIAWGKQENGDPWQIGIADPAKEKEFIAWLNVSNMSVVTSGNYEKYVLIDGKKYGHILHPKTGYPVEGIKSVTLLSPDAELSDALATSVFVLGVHKGLELVNRLKNVECIILDEQNKMWQSNNLKMNYY